MDSDTIVKYIQKDGSAYGGLQKLGEYADQVHDHGQASNSTSDSYQMIVYPPIWMASPEDGSNKIVVVSIAMLNWSSSFQSNPTYKAPSLSQAFGQPDYMSGDRRIAVGDAMRVALGARKCTMVSATIKRGGTFMSSAKI
jgi:hypothetical protein